METLDAGWHHVTQFGGVKDHLGGASGLEALIRRPNLSVSLSILAKHRTRVRGYLPLLLDSLPQPCDADIMLNQIKTFPPIFNTRHSFPVHFLIGDHSCIHNPPFIRAPNSPSIPAFCKPVFLIFFFWKHYRVLHVIFVSGRKLFGGCW